MCQKTGRCVGARGSRVRQNTGRKGPTNRHLSHETQQTSSLSKSPELATSYSSVTSSIPACGNWSNDPPFQCEVGVPSTASLPSMVGAVTPPPDRTTLPRGRSHTHPFIRTHTHAGCSIRPVYNVRRRRIRRSALSPSLSRRHILIGWTLGQRPAGSSRQRVTLFGCSIINIECANRINESIV